MTTLYYGDPHTQWRPLLRAAQSLDSGDTVVILGDCDLEQTIKAVLAPLFEHGIRVLWIPGNHDSDHEHWYDNLFGSHPGGNIHCRPVISDDRVIAGYGGVFKENIWWPKADLAEPLYSSPADFMRKSCRPPNRWRKGLPMGQRATCWRSEWETVADMKLDVLVTHEAPASTHKYGFVGIDELARRTRAGLVVHGHHHRSSDVVNADGVRVVGLAKAEVFVAGEGIREILLRM